nr:hybrid sensor histidine kinase/response regulator transcription factor [uncultured Bacteroides sp.]
MKTPFKSLIIIIFSVISIVAKAELTNKMFEIRHVGYAEGLSNQRVFSIVEDGEGVIWISTKTGIDRFNGHSVKNYAWPGSFYYGDLAGRRLYLLYDVRKGLLAYDHTGRIYRYSAINDNFEQVLHLGQFIHEDVILNKLCIDHDGALWIGLDKGLYKQEADGALVTVLKGQYVNDIVTAGEMLFAGTSTGVWQISHGIPANVHQILDGWYVQTLFYDAFKKELWIGTFDNGLSVINLNTSRLLTLEEQKTGFFHPIRAITLYDSHTMLVGVDGGGVYSVDRDTKKVRLLMNAEDSTDTFLRGNGVYTVVKDCQGNIWIGSYTGGVSVAILLRYPISLLAHEKGNPHSLFNNNVNGIEENVEGNLWLATDGGVSIRNKMSDTWKHVLKETVVISLCKSGDGTVWVGTYGNGVYLLDAEGRVLRHLTKQKGELTTNYIFSVMQDMDGDLWIGGLDGCLLMLDKKGEQRRLFDVKWVQSIKSIDGERIAVATVNGFYIIDKHTGNMQHYATSREFNNKNASAYIISMLFNGDGTVWLGTEGGGLNLYDMKSRTLKTFTTQEGLPSNDIYSLALDGKNRLWVSTGKGIALIDSFRVSNLNYVGNIDKEYNKSSFVRLKSGEFVYGSTNGAVSIMPLAISTAEYRAPLRFTSLTVDYQDADEAKTLRPVIHDMLAGGEVRLGYNHNSFGISFESINYRFQRDIVYRYILEGYDNNWSEPSADGRVQYAKVLPGDYLFKVQSLRRSDGKIISEGVLKVNILQPWWNSWWAWTLYVCMVLFVFYFILRYKGNQLQKKYDEDKIRFFVDTAHDIRTPVTLIMAPLEDLSKEQGLSEKARYYLNLAHEGTTKLYSLITQLLEFEKVDTNNQQLALVPLNLNAILSEEYSAFRPFCDKKQVSLKLSMPDECIYVPADKHFVEMMLDNLLSNACKYTKTQGEICLSLEVTKRKAIVVVKDNGIGIPKKARKHIFADIYRAENARSSQEEGTGFGLLQVHRIVKMLHGKVSFRSEEGKGTTFTVTLPRTVSAVEPMSYPTDVSDENIPVSSKDINVQDTVAVPEVNDTDNIGGHDDRNTLLIVEDHEALRYYLRQTFERDYRVVDVADGQEALVYLENEYPDIILSDVMMPGIQGDELCRLVKENPDTSGIPFILLTAKVNHDAVVEGLKKGADDYIPKPFSTEILKLKVQGLIDNRNRQRAFFMRQAITQVEVRHRSAGDEEEMEAVEVVVENDGGTPDDLPVETISESDRQFIVQATRFVIDHLDDLDFNINLLCQEMAMSRTLFYSRLKSLTGKGPQEFIRIIRLQKAAELLKEGKSVAEVATDTGFVNTKYFSSLFKKQFGMQPSKYGAAH